MSETLAALPEAPFNFTQKAVNDVMEMARAGGDFMSATQADMHERDIAMEGLYYRMYKTAEGDAEKAIRQAVGFLVSYRLLEIIDPGREALDDKLVLAYEIDAADDPGMVTSDFEADYVQRYRLAPVFMDGFSNDDTRYGARLALVVNGERANPDRQPMRRLALPEPPKRPARIPPAEIRNRKLAARASLNSGAPVQIHRGA